MRERRGEKRWEERQGERREKGLQPKWRSFFPARAIRQYGTGRSSIPVFTRRKPRASGCKGWHSGAKTQRKGRQASSLKNSLSAASAVFWSGCTLASSAARLVALRVDHARNASRPRPRDATCTFVCVCVVVCVHMCTSGYLVLSTQVSQTSRFIHGRVLIKAPQQHTCRWT